MGKNAATGCNLTGSEKISGKTTVFLGHAVPRQAKKDLLWAGAEPPGRKKIFCRPARARGGRKKTFCRPGRNSPGQKDNRFRAVGSAPGKKRPFAGRGGTAHGKKTTRPGREPPGRVAVFGGGAVALRRTSPHATVPLMKLRLLNGKSSFMSRPNYCQLPLGGDFNWNSEYGPWVGMTPVRLFRLSAY